MRDEEPNVVGREKRKGEEERREREDEPRL